MKRGLARFSRLTEMKRRPLQQKGRYLLLSITLGLVPFLLFRLSVFYEVTFPIAAPSYSTSNAGGSNATQIDLGLPSLRERSNFRPDEAAWKEDKDLLQNVHDNGARDSQGFKQNGEQQEDDRQYNKSTGKLDNIELDELASAAETAKVVRDAKNLEMEDAIDLEGKDEEERKLKEEDERRRGEEEQARRGEEERKRLEDEERKREEEEVRKRKEEEERRRKDEAELNKKERFVDTEGKDGVEQRKTEDEKDNASQAANDGRIESTKEQSLQGTDPSLITEVTTATDANSGDGGEEEGGIKSKEEQPTEHKSSDEETKLADDPGKEDDTQEGNSKAAEVLTRDERLFKRLGHCDLFDGVWEYEEADPLYTNDTCPYLQGDQNCLLNGRPDRSYLHWRWKPRGCDLPKFDAEAFMQAFKGKTIGFVGDSLARNQMQSLLCMLFQVEKPIVLYDSDYIKYSFEQHHVKLVVVWAPYLVTHSSESVDGYDFPSVMHMDVLDRAWTSRIDEMDIMIVSIGQWFFHANLFVRQQGKEILGCYHCGFSNVTDIGFLDMFREALRLGLDKIVSEMKGIVVFHTFGVQHFEHGGWESGWCRRDKPILAEEASGFGWMNYEMRAVVLDEFTRVLDSRSQGDNSLYFDLIDITRVNMLRADAHPGPYRSPYPYAHRDPNEWVQNDCLHWCMPGAVDTWNHFLLNIAQRNS